MKPIFSGFRITSWLSVPTRFHAWLRAELGQRDLFRPLPLCRAALISFLPVLLLAFVGVWAGRVPLSGLVRVPDWRLPDPSHNLAMGYADIFVLTPLVETGLIVFFIKFFRKLRCPEVILPYFCAVVWGLLHARYHGSPWGMIAAWPFCCYTHIILAREKPSLDRAWLAASAVHALTNVFGALSGAGMSGILAP